MDSTELHYLTYDPDEIWDEMTRTYVDEGGDILYPGDEKEMLLRAVQADIVQVFAGTDNALRMQTLRYAVGTYLDVIGENRGCERIEASAATATVTITTKATGSPSVMEAGTKMTADGEIFYLLQNDVTLSGYQESVVASVIADRTGSIGNGLLSGMEMGLSVPNDAVDSIIVATDAVGGNEREEDETYRERIRGSGLTTVLTGPERQYEEKAKAVSSVILDARAVNITDGTVGVYLILSTDTGAAALIESVEEALSPANVRPLTDQVFVYQATDIPYVLNVEVRSDGSSAITAAIADAVNTYQEWQDNSIGLAFNPDRLMAAIYQAGATRVTWGEGSCFDTSGDVEYTEIGQTQRCKGTITLTRTT